MIGQTLARYRVLEELGAGGMGTVYRAEDLRLQRSVALKALSPDLLFRPEALESFRREARTAAALNHPSICAVHDVFEHEGRPYIVMELLHGRSLRDELQAGPLPLERTLALATDVAAAMVAAHERGIVHRDLKPANVFVSPDGRRAKVVDFGLARPAPAPASPEGEPSDPTLTRGVDADTPAYASPEQVRGEELDARSDIFSFGAVLYEMATGRRAFPGVTPAAVYDAVLNREPLAPGALVPDLPAGLEDVVLRCLRKERGARYATSRELAEDLAAVSRAVAGASAPTVAIGGSDRRGLAAARARNRRIAGAAVLLVVLATAALLAGLYLRKRHPAPELAARDRLLLADFANRTGEPVFDLTLREALAVQLGQSPSLTIVSDDRVRETLRMMTLTGDERLDHALAREVCERQAARAMLEGQIAALGRSYVLTLEATDCASGESLGREQAEAEGKEGVLSVLDRMASTMRARLGDSLARVGRFDVPIEQATTRSLDALKAYALAMASRAKGDDIGAIPLLEHAVLLDPSFASAHSALSAIYGGLGETRERASHARLAYENRGHVTEWERLYIEYQHHDAIGDERRAVEVLELWQRLYPRDYRAPNALAVALNRQGQYERAIETAREAERRNPQHPFPRSNLAYALRGAGRFAESRRTVDDAIAARLETLPLRRLQYQLALLQGDAVTAARTLEWARGHAREFDIVGAQAQAAAYAGRIALARSLYQQTADMARRQGLQQVALGYASLGAWTEALYGNAAQAQAQARAIVAADPAGAPRMRAAAALALAGDPDAAAVAIAGAKPPGSEDTFVTTVYAPVAQAALLLARRRGAAAFAALEPARPYELGNVALLAPVFLRGRALMQQGDAAGAAREFQRVIDQRGVDPFSPLHALAGLELARAVRGAGDTAASRAAYDRFLASWAEAEATLPLLVAARRERAALR